MWDPIASEDRAEHVWEAIEDIAEALAPLEAPAADLAMFWAYYASAREDAVIEERAEASVERFANELGEGYPTAALIEGLAGAGWVCAHLAGEAGELLDVIDRKLFALLEPGAWAGDFDVVAGVAGLGVYFLERDGDAGSRGRELVVERLAAMATRDPRGVRWRTPPEFLADHVRARWPDGASDCGVAHGTAGVIGVLSRIAARDDAPPEAGKLAADATRWLLAQRQNGHFPALVAGMELAPAREGWCYGSPGSALALGGRADLCDWLALPADVIAAEGPGLCHGAATLVHASNRMFHATREPRFHADAIAWLDRLLAFHDPDAPFAGFADPAASGPRRACILTGATGTGLALLATVSDLEPSWDRMLLMDVQLKSRNGT